MNQKHLKLQALFYLSALLFIFISKANASDLIEVLPLTDKIILLHFDDGNVTYPNTLKVERLVITDADNKSTYLFTSTDDNDFVVGLVPSNVGRKTKGTEFVKDPPWGNNSADPRTKPWASEHWIYLVFDKPMKKGKTYELNVGKLAKNASSWKFTFEEKNLRSEAVHVNTIGYAANAPKYGYIYQWMGSLGGLKLSDYAGRKFWLYKENENNPVKEGVIKFRKSAVNAETGQSNDTPDKNFLGSEVYECDFTDINTDGTYKLVVEGMGCSYPFKIGKDAVFEAYYNCARALYHQRSGIRLAPPYTAPGYIRPVNQNTKLTSDDGESFAGKLLYSDYSFMDWENSDGGGTSQTAIRDAANGKTLDVAGWYHDAGDWDSYWTHQRIPILLMLAFESAPERFMDGDLDLPESGNGIPDILDEASWLIKFNYRLRKELKAKSYSNGGVGGARICADPFTSLDGNAESTRPSWKENRRTVVTKADAFMTYLYAGEAAQFAFLLKKLGKNPSKYEVEMLDNVEFAKMTKDNVNWINEAEEAYSWASSPENQPASRKNYDSGLGIYRMYAAVNLFRITGKEVYHTAAKTELEKLKNSSNLADDERWGVYSYLLNNNFQTDKVLQTALKSVAINTANARCLNALENRACRWGGNYDMPMLVGQATTPWVFESIIAYAITGDKKYSDAVHTTADYFLGCNPLHASWATGVGPRPPAVGFHLDTRYNNNWKLYPGFVPYGPWSMAYGYEPYTYKIDGVDVQGGQGTWNKDWANFSMSPLMANWPGHERWNSNIHAPMSSENTVHQNAVYAGLTYGFVNARENSNLKAKFKVGSIKLDKSSISFSKQGDEEVLSASLDIDNASFSLLKWESTDPRIAFVDGFGRVTASIPGNCKIICSTLDGSVFTQCDVTCNWSEMNVDSIKIEPVALTLFEGQAVKLNIQFYPASVTNKYVNWLYDLEGIVKIDEDGQLTALAKGKVIITATSLNGSRKAICDVEVKEKMDYVIADFDLVIPVTTEPQPDKAQIYTPNGTNDIVADNPLKGLANQSDKVVKWNRPKGDWVLIGMVLPTKEPQDLSKFSQFQFKYYGKNIKDFYIQLITEDNSQIEINENFAGEDCWKLYAYNLSSTSRLKQFNVFVNKQGNPDAITCYFDDFKLAGNPVVKINDLNISKLKLDLNSGQSELLTADAKGYPFTWISTNDAVVSVNQDGKITAVSKGTASVKAVPLYGEAVECLVNVDGGGNEPPVSEKKMILDFEKFELDWSGGYGSYGWNTDKQGKTNNPLKNSDNPSDKVITWERDNTFGGGFAVQFPAEKTTGWTRITLQVYSSQPFNNIRLELMDGEVSQGSQQKEKLGVDARTWKTITFEIADLNAANKSFNKILLQVGVGTQDTMKVWVDNILLEKGDLPAIVKVTGVSIEGPSAISLEKGNSTTLKAIIVPSNADNKVISWSSSNSGIVSVSDAGLVKALAAGKVTIAVTAIDGNKTATCEITVTEKTSVSYTETSENELILYPNPFNKGELRLKSASFIGEMNLKIIDISGRIVFISSHQSGNNVVITPNLKSGLYLVRLENSQNMHQMKLMVSAK